MQPKVMQAIVSKINQLPTLPQVITHLMKIMENPDSSANEVSKIISTDQALMTKVLKLVNSSFYGVPKRVSTLTQATVILGFASIKNLALTASIFDQFDSDGGQVLPGGFTREKFWEHSLACGVAAKTLAEHIRYKEPEEAFMAGLIHDMGKVMMDQYLHEDFVRVLAYAHEHHLRILDAEYEILGADHSQVGCWLAEKWNLPAHFVSVIADHHRPLQSKTATQLTSIVHLADAIVRMENYGNGGDNVEPRIDDHVWTEISVKQEVLPTLLKEIRLGYDNALDFLTMVVKK